MHRIMKLFWYEFKADSVSKIVFSLWITVFLMSAMSYRNVFETLFPNILNLLIAFGYYRTVIKPKHEAGLYRKYEQASDRKFERW